MGKDPAFLFYSADFLVGTLTMGFENKGKYITILCLMHQKGRMSEDEIIAVIGDFNKVLKEKFLKDEAGFYFNPRLEEEREKRARHSKKQRENVMKRWNKPNQKKGGYQIKNIPPYIPNENVGITTVIPLENENENVIENKNKIKKGGVGEKIKKPKYRYTEAVDLYERVLEFFPTHLRPKTTTVRSQWISTLEKLMRIDGLDPLHIGEIIHRTRKNDFWAKNFLSVSKLRKKNSEGIPYIVVFAEQIPKDDSADNFKKNLEGW